MYSDNDFRSYELYHHGIKGQKWGIRRYQNVDGSLTEEGKKRYSGSSERRRYVTFANGKAYYTLEPQKSTYTIPKGKLLTDQMKLTASGKAFKNQIDEAYEKAAKFRGEFAQKERIKDFENWDESYWALYNSPFNQGTIEDKLLRNYSKYCEDKCETFDNTIKKDVKRQFHTMNNEQNAFFTEQFYNNCSKDIWEKADLSKSRKYELAYEMDPNSKQCKSLYSDILSKAKSSIEPQLYNLYEIEADGYELTKDQINERKHLNELLDEINKTNR